MRSQARYRFPGDHFCGRVSELPGGLWGSVFCKYRRSIMSSAVPVGLGRRVGNDFQRLL